MKPRPYRRRTMELRVQLLVLLLLGLVVAAALTLLWYYPPHLEPMPEVALEGLEPEAVQLIETAQNLVQQDLRSAMAWGDLAAVLRAHDFGPECEVCFRNAALLDPTDYRWPYLLGVSRFPSDPEEAISLWRKAVGRGGKPPVKLRLAEHLLDRGQDDEATKLIDEVLAAAPRDPRAQLARARLLLAAGKLEESRLWAEKSVATAPDKRATRQLLAQVCRRLGDADGQALHLAALEEIPGGITEWDDPDVEAMLNLRRDRNWKLAAAKHLTASGATLQARAMLVEMAEREHIAAGPALQLGDMLLQNKLWAEAETMLRKNLVRHPENERLHFQLGVAYFMQDKFEPAVKEFRRVIELKSDHIDAWYNLGHALKESGDKAGARAAFAAAVQLSPSHIDARINLADLLLQNGQVEEARRHLDVAAQLAPGHTRVRDLLRRAAATAATEPAKP